MPPEQPPLPVVFFRVGRNTTGTCMRAPLFLCNFVSKIVGRFLLSRRQRQPCLGHAEARKRLSAKLTKGLPTTGKLMFSTHLRCVLLINKFSMNYLCLLLPLPASFVPSPWDVARYAPAALKQNLFGNSLRAIQS